MIPRQTSGALVQRVSSGTIRAQPSACRQRSPVPVRGRSGDTRVTNLCDERQQRIEFDFAEGCGGIHADLRDGARRCTFGGPTRPLARCQQQLRQTIGEQPHHACRRDTRVHGNGRSRNKTQGTV